MTSSRRSATTSTPASSETPSARTTNSSPPSRPTVSFSRTALFESNADAHEEFVAGAVAEGVVDVLEVVEVEEERGDVRVLASGARQHSVDAVEDQCAIGQSGERVVQRLVLQLIGSLLHQFHGARSTRARARRSSSPSKRLSRTPPRKRSVESPSPKTPPATAAVKTWTCHPLWRLIDSRASLLRAIAGRERDVRATALVVKRDGVTGMTDQRRGQDRLGQYLRAGEANEVARRRGHGAGVAAVAIERRAHREGGRTAQASRGRTWVGPSHGLAAVVVRVTSHRGRARWGSR